MGALETVVDDAGNHGLPPECAKMLRDIVFRTNFDLFCRAVWGEPPVRGAYDREASARYQGRVVEAA